LDELADAAVPRSIRLAKPLAGGNGRSEPEVLAELRALASQNRIYRSYLGMATTTA